MSSSTQTPTSTALWPARVRRSISSWVAYISLSQVAFFSAKKASDLAPFSQTTA